LIEIVSGVHRMSLGSEFQASGSATKNEQSPILVAVRIYGRPQSLSFGQCSGGLNIAANVDDHELIWILYNFIHVLVHLKTTDDLTSRANFFHGGKVLLGLRQSVL